MIMYQDQYLHDLWVNVLKGICWIPWTDSLVDYFFDHLKKQSENLWPIKKTPFLRFLKYLRETYFDPSATFNFKLWNHYDQLLTYGNPDCTTNCCESINSGLNKDCPALRTPNSVFNKVLKHKRGFLNKYSWVVELNHLSKVRRSKK